MNPCPSTFALDDAEIHGGPAAAAIVRHLEACERCQRRDARRDALGQRFSEALGPALSRRLDVARRERPRRRWRQYGLGASLLAGAAAVVVVAARRPEAYRATKGDLTVAIAARRGGAVFAVDPATEVGSGDELQFTVRDARAGAGRYVLVGSVDGTGKFSAFYPASVEGRSVPLPPAGAPLSPPVVLDDAPGPERIVVVVSDRPVEGRVLAPLVESGLSGAGLAAALGGGETTTRSIVLAKHGPRGTRP